jgi:hypothetical protein
MGAPDFCGKLVVMWSQFAGAQHAPVTIRRSESATADRPGQAG